MALVAAGEPDVDFENGVTANGVPITNFFDQIVSPNQDDVTLVNAISSDSDITADPATLSQTVENDRTLQTLG